MADSASEVDLESDTSSVEGGPISKAHSPVHPEQLQRRIESLLQENKTLKLELETCKQRCKQLQEENLIQIYDDIHVRTHRVNGRTFVWSDG